MISLSSEKSKNNFLQILRRCSGCRTGKLIWLFLLIGIGDVSFCQTIRPPIQIPKTSVTVFDAKIGFKNSKMSSSRMIPFPEYQSIGIVVGDTIEFSSILTSNLALPASRYEWSGAKQGTGSNISVTFTIGTSPESETVQVGGISKTANVAVVEIPSPFPGENLWCIQHPTVCPTVISDGLESLDWAEANESSLGGNLSNGRADAARHSYWHAIMVADGVDPFDALEAGMAHENDNLNNGDPHNEIAMDLRNNSRGVAIGTSLGVGATRSASENAIRVALNAGTLTILDEFGNSEWRGLLQPSNK